MSTDVRLRLPDSGEWMFASAADEQAYTSVRLYLYGNEDARAATGFSTASEALARGYDQVIGPHQHQDAIRVARRAWAATPEVRQVRRAVLAVLREPESALASVAAAGDVASHLLAAQPDRREGRQVEVEAMVRIALECEQGAHRPALGAQRTGDRDLVVAATGTPLADRTGLGLGEILAVGARAAELGAVMFPAPITWPPPWGPMRSAELAAMVHGAEPTLAAAFDMADPFLPAQQHRSLADLRLLGALPTPGLAGLVASGSPQGRYNRAADVLYDARVTFGHAVGHVLWDRQESLAAWVGAGERVLAERIEEMARATFDQARPGLFKGADFAAAARTFRAAHTRPAVSKSAAAPRAGRKSSRRGR